MRRALVLGGGGVLGGTWAIAALHSLQEVRGLASSDFDVIVGTSAGSLLGALLSAGVTPADLVRHYRNERIESGPLAGVLWDPNLATGGPRPGVPRFRPGSLALLSQAVRHPGAVPPTAVLSAVLPTGARSLERIGHLVEAAVPHGDWPASLWVCTMNFSTGRRTVFGRSGSPVASAADAVMASCAIPGWFQPVLIGGIPYVDGGAISATNVDLLAGQGMDEVVVIAPMASLEPDHPRAIGTRMERRWRQEVTKAAIAESAILEEEGTSVLFMAPGAEELTAIGANLMDSRRRRNVLETSLEVTSRRWQELREVG
jgi:NTE family protein